MAGYLPADAGTLFTDFVKIEKFGREEDHNTIASVLQYNSFRLTIQ